jgi:chromosome segregation ATPase
VEDEQKQIQELTEELSATNQRLANVSQEHHILRQRLQRSEAENLQQADRLKATMEASDAVSRANAQAHAMAMEEREQEIKNLAKSIAVMELMVEMKDAEIKTLSHENGTLNQDVASRDDLNGRREELFNELKNEADVAVRELWSYKERNEAALDAERKEKNKLRSQVDELSTRLEDLEIQLKERCEEVKRLRMSRKSVSEALLRAKSKEDQRLDVTAGNNRIRALELDISGYVSTILQLRNLLKAAESAAEGRAREINDLRTRLTTLEEDLDAKDEELNHVSTACCSREGSINNFHEAMAELEAKNKVNIMKLEESIGALQNTIHTSEATIHELQRDIDAQRQRHEARAKEDQTRISELENTVSTTRDKYREMRSRYEASEQSRRMMLDQLARREEENRNHDSSLSFNLSSSIIRDPAQPNADQVYTLLNNLNYEIFQTAALFADSLCTTERSSSSTHNNTINELLDEESTSLLGPYLLSLVRSQSTTPLDTYDPYPLQTAIQATLVCCATRIMTAWYPGHWDQSDFLAATYARIREAEGIPASDTWKTMTRARLRPTTSTVLRVVDFLEECLSTIFRYAGWSTANQSPSILPPNTTQTVDLLLKENREKLSALARHSLRLNVILDNVSPQLEPTLVEPGSIFDHYVMEREDADVRCTRDDDKEEVVATCEIGLRKAAEGGGSSSNGRRRSVIKPKVILRSAFDT